ncbi:MAG: glutamate--tRNA ligase [Fimbriimonas sp.]|nr:glutamate--tRNA ligase [Fimbriimonas sp.]
MSVRVRFAPSPTGMLHVGALRDALFKSLFARHWGGQNILRIEDTDRTRYSPESEQEFIDTLKWVGIEFDEGPHIGGPNAPYRQSERKEAGIYAEWIVVLLGKGHAYKAFDTPEQLEEMREIQMINKRPSGYFGGIWRDGSPEQVAAAEAEGKPFVIRQRIPRDTAIVIEDAIRGRVEWDSNTVDDPVLIKADGMPTYHFASMVDDHVMEITHIIRGEEWLSSAPKHACLFDSFGWDRPIFVHCPVIVGTDGKKLSKRHGATRVLDYAARGFLKQALKNFIALIGWSPGDDREAMTEQELIEAFDIKGIQPSPGKFDYEKLKWLNGCAIRALDPEQLLQEIADYLARPYTTEYFEQLEPEPGSPNPKDVLRTLLLLRTTIETDRAYALEAIKLEQQRVQTLADFGEACEFFFVDLPPMDQKAVDKWFKDPVTASLFAYLLEECSSAYLSESGPEVYDASLRAFQAAYGLEKLGPVVHPTRVALTGKTTGPGLFELMSVLGPARIAARVERAKGLLK